MIRFNYHTHTRFCDGRSEPEQYVQEALRQGMHSLGFSAHSPLPFDTPFAIHWDEVEEYCQIILELKQMYADRLPIYLSLEIDFIPGISEDFDRLRNSYPLDYTIGSVHLVRPDDREGLWFIDGPMAEIYDSGLQELFDGDIQRAVSAYYRYVNQMITGQRPTIIGHLDKIKMHNKGRHFAEDEPWYVRLMEETLDTIQETGGIVEVNTRGIYKKRSEDLYPGKPILQSIRKRNIPVTISTDAHRPEELTAHFDETVKILTEIGFRSVMYLENGKWEEYTLC
ncbi:MAG: histidinol-phosphatase [Bacteroidales bacterium]|nr:histidinol-phosphatase [Lentimicrobiaceae bacterium]MDD5694162.1 histidinol-phosphatase [Bacteroidales bacterium]